MAEFIIFVVLMIPVYLLLIWSYLDPKESFLFGERWMYKKEPELTENAIKILKLQALAAIALLMLVKIIWFVNIPI
ncbi:MAG TPA: hypothetical protein VNR38_10495 [Ureibacillus sp.]|nr:hypothetical protein [Ureibacillus sp.]